MIQTTIPGFGLVEKLLGPTAQRLGSKLADLAEIAWHNLFNALDDHLQRSIERYSYFTSVVFPNEQKRLDDYYLPLTVVDAEGKVVQRVSRYPHSLLEQFKSLLIVDTAGMGKSTLMKFMFLCAAREQAAIPVFVELRKLRRDKPLLEYIFDQLQALDKSTSKAVLFRVIEEGQFAFFLDGYDEIPEEHREAVASDIQDFKSKANKNYFLMASREHKGLLAFADFKRLGIKPLAKSEAYELIKKYSKTTDFAQKLVERLEQPENISVHEFLTNPLLVSLLFKSFEYKATIPLKKHVFYWQVYEALFEAHDLTKGSGEFVRAKRSGLDLDSFHRITRAIGILSLSQQQLEYLPDQLMRTVEKGQEIAALRGFAPSDLVHDLSHAVPLFIVDGNYLRWAHKSIQEYFAAAYICADSKERHGQILVDLYESQRFDQYLNTLSLCYDLDPKVFRQKLLLRVLQALVSLAEKMYAWADGKIERRLLDERRSLLTPNKLIAWRERGVTTIRGRRDAQHDPFEWHKRALEIIRKKEPGFPISQSTYLETNPTIINFAHSRTTNFFRAMSRSPDFAFVVRGRLGEREEHLRLDEPDEYFLVVDDSDPNAFFNRPENFEAFNSRLRLHAEWWVNIDAAKATLANITAEMAHDASVSFAF